MFSAGDGVKSKHCVGQRTLALNDHRRSVADTSTHPRALTFHNELKALAPCETRHGNLTYVDSSIAKGQLAKLRLQHRLPVLKGRVKMKFLVQSPRCKALINILH